LALSEQLALDELKGGAQPTQGTVFHGKKTSHVVTLSKTTGNISHLRYLASKDVEKIPEEKMT
jgi:hypothetical protein